VLLNQEAWYIHKLIYQPLIQKISNLEKLLNLYSTNQIVDSDSIGALLIPGTPPSIKLNSIATNYERIYVYNATDMYNLQA
jgi:hypothetical protein